MKNLKLKLTNRFNHKDQSGFTIIEVMIVLAIAGLILAIVFIAVPQLQRSSRDNQRQNISARVKAELESYASNNSGSYPFAGVSGVYNVCSSVAACNDWYTRYITNGNDNTTDPSTGTAEVVNISTSSSTPTWAKGNIWISVGNKCSGEGVAAGLGGGATARQYAILIALDRNSTFYCLDNG